MGSKFVMIIMMMIDEVIAELEETVYLQYKTRFWLSFWHAKQQVNWLPLDSQSFQQTGRNGMNVNPPLQKVTGLLPSK